MNAWLEFAHMGGYGLYVWGSVGAFVLGLAWEQWHLRRQHRQALACLAEASEGRP